MIKDQASLGRQGVWTRRAVLSLPLAAPFLLRAAKDNNGYGVIYDGGSQLPQLKAGKQLRLFIAPDEVRLALNREELVNIPAHAITEISYGQDVHRRVGAAIGLAVVSLGIGALMALSKSKKHFVGLTWDNAGQKGGVAFQVSKNEYRGVLAGLEGISGKKAVDSEAMTVKN